jgi:hypothetical protein
MFVIFAWVEWSAILRMSRHSVTDVFDLMFLLFEGFWVLGWSVGVVILAALAVLLLFYGESARLQDGKLIYIPRLGPVMVLLDYELGRIRNLRLESVGSENAVRLRFDYGDGVIGLGDTMPRTAAQRLLDTIGSATGRVVPLNETELRPVFSVASSVPRTVVEPPVSIMSPSGLALIAANLVPLVGVLFFQWDLASVMVLFWAESAVIGFYTALKMAVVGKFAALLAVPFFVGHFGGFMAAHFMFIYLFFLREAGAGPDRAAGEALRLTFFPLWPSIAALFISHGISFVTNFIGRREFAATTMTALMKAPYNRIILMQLVLILGGWVILLLKTPVAALVLLVLVKTALDFSAHRKERARVRTSP